MNVESRRYAARVLTERDVCECDYSNNGVTLKIKKRNKPRTKLWHQIQPAFHWLVGFRDDPPSRKKLLSILCIS
jgi:hypothetical protein